MSKFPEIKPGEVVRILHAEVPPFAHQLPVADPVPVPALCEMSGVNEHHDTGAEREWFCAAPATQTNAAGLHVCDEHADEPELGLVVSDGRMRTCGRVLTSTAVCPLGECCAKCPVLL